MSLKEKAINGSKWALVENLLNTGTTFLISIVLARILTPDDYGLVGMTSFFVIIFSVFMRSGFAQAIIKDQEATQKDYSTIFFTNILTSLFLYIILFTTSPFIASFFGKEILSPILRILGLTMIIEGLSLVQSALRTKYVDFKSLAKISITGTIVGGAIGIILALNDYGVWSLVAQTITRTAINTTLFWIISKWRPSYFFSFVLLKKHFRYGIHLLRSDIILAISDNIFYLVIGKYYSPAYLGQYTKAEAFVNLFSRKIVQVTGNNVSFPILCSIHEDRDELRRVFIRILRTISFTSCSVLAFFVAISDTFIPLAIGDQWMQSIIFIKILSISAFLYPIKAFCIYIANVVGRTDVYANAVFFQQFLIVPVAVLGIFTNIYVLVWGSVFVSICSFMYNMIKVERLIQISMKEQLIVIFKTNFIPLLCALTTWFAGIFMQFNLYITLCLQIIIGLSLTVSMLEWSKHTIYLELKNILLNEYKKTRKHTHE